MWLAYVRFPDGEVMSTPSRRRQRGTTLPPVHRASPVRSPFSAPGPPSQKKGRRRPRQASSHSPSSASPSSAGAPPPPLPPRVNSSLGQSFVVELAERRYANDYIDAHTQDIAEELADEGVFDPVRDGAHGRYTCAENRERKARSAARNFDPQPEPSRELRLFWAKEPRLCPLYDNTLSHLSLGSSLGKLGTSFALDMGRTLEDAHLPATTQEEFRDAQDQHMAAGLIQVAFRGSLSRSRTRAANTIQCFTRWEWLKLRVREARVQRSIRKVLKSLMRRVFKGMGDYVINMRKVRGMLQVHMARKEANTFRTWAQYVVAVKEERALKVKRTIGRFKNRRASAAFATWNAHVLQRRGARSMLGKHLASMTMKLFLEWKENVVILREFRLSAQGESRAPLYNYISVSRNIHTEK